MCFEKYSPLARAILGGFLGVVVGIVSGIAFSSLIVLVIHLLHSGAALPRPELPPYAIAQFLGGGAGAIIGSIVGAIYSNKK